MGKQGGAGTWFRALGGTNSGHKKGPRRPPRWKTMLASAFSRSAWRRRLGVVLTVLYMVAFRIMYVVEAIALAALVGIYFCRFGCRV